MNMEQWTTGLFDCMQDPSNAFITALFPCITFGQIADVLDNGHTNCVTSGIIYAFSPCILSRPYRAKLRRRFRLLEIPTSDYIAHSLFEPCALCQEYRELKNRGIDPALGYHGNLEKLQNQQGGSPAMMPPKNQAMTT
ncbi:protein PLANT CADMIUM RESISTANCE 6-like [Rhodamnia argentea]|uniref:Protein PLANT CADMIUM RESISTANCE 6-like n=1 Tax=Rhodamnia argentea TaxID=178133 RepID=A0A8B8QPJ0_9MYRT|nr:protein PLANT CADMIUM RESISTANCE 6-like [Rhodamnia argentea]